MMGTRPGLATGGSWCMALVCTGLCWCLLPAQPRPARVRHLQPPPHPAAPQNGANPNPYGFPAPWGRRLGGFGGSCSSSWHGAGPEAGISQGPASFGFACLHPARGEERRGTQTPPGAVFPGGGLLSSPVPPLLWFCCHQHSAWQLRQPPVPPLPSLRCDLGQGVGEKQPTNPLNPRIHFFIPRSPFPSRKKAQIQ